MRIEVINRVGIKTKGEYRGWNQMGNLRLRMRQGNVHRDRSIPYTGILTVIDLDTGEDVTKRVMALRKPTDPVHVSRKSYFKK